MYSAIFEAVDNVGNVAKARAFFLYDNNSDITIDSDYPVRIDGAQAVDLVYWITSLHQTVTVSWKNRFVFITHSIFILFQ